MQVLSSYGVELRKQNIPIHQTLEIYRSAVSYLTEIYGQVWEDWNRFPIARDASMPRSIWYIPRKRFCTL